MKPFLAFHEALYLKPLLYGLERNDSPFHRVVDIPALIAMNMSKPARVQGTSAGKRIKLEGAGCAFLSPIDYARHGAEYCIVPTVAVSSSRPTGAIELYVNSDVYDIETMAVDIRVTSEIILAKIILMEKYPNSEQEEANVQIVPMMPNLDAMLSKADAALLVNVAPIAERKHDGFKLDLVEEWYDLTDLPYVHGFWVGRQDEMLIDDVRRLIRAKKDGVALHRRRCSCASSEGTGAFCRITQPLPFLVFIRFHGTASRESERAHELRLLLRHSPRRPRNQLLRCRRPSKLNSN